MEKIMSGFYNNKIDRTKNEYNNSFKATKYKGVLIDKEEKDILVDLKNGRYLKGVTKEPLKETIGEEVSIDKRELKSFKIIDEDSLNKQKIVEDSDLKRLEGLGIEKSKSNLEALKSIEKYGLEINKDNILDFALTKKQIDSVINKIDYEKAMQLVDKDIDVSSESLDKISKELDEIKPKKEGFLKRLFKRNKDISTLEAQKIAKDIYGSKMGKDVTDIIKILKKNNIEINRDKIEEVNRTFSKLHNIKDLENNKIVDIVKNKIEPSIDNIYKMKKGIKKGLIDKSSESSLLASNLYQNSNKKAVISKEQLDLLEYDIKKRLDGFGMAITTNNIDLSKELIKGDLSISKENLENVFEIKDSISFLSQNLDINTLTYLSEEVKEDIEKLNINELKDLVKEFKAKEELIENLSDKNKELLNKLSLNEKNFKDIKEEDLVKLIREKENITLRDIDKLLKSRSNKTDKTLDVNNSDSTNRIKINLLNTLGQIKNNVKSNIGFHMGNNMNISIESLKNSNNYIENKENEERLILNKKGEPKEIENLKNENKALLKEISSKYNKDLNSSTIVDDKYNDKIKAYMMSIKSNLDLEGTKEDIDNIKIIMKNRVPLNEANISKFYNKYNDFTDLESKLSKKDVSLKDLKNIEVKELSDAKKYIEELPSERSKVDSIKSLKESSNLDKKLEQHQEIASKMEYNNIKNKLSKLDIKTISFFIKNQLPISLETLKLGDEFLKGDISKLEFKESIRTIIKGETFSKEEDYNNKLLKNISDLDIPDKHKTGFETLIQNKTNEYSEKLGLRYSKKEIKDVIRSLINQNMSINDKNIFQSLDIKRAISTIEESLKLEDYQYINLKNINLEKIPLNKALSEINISKEEIEKIKLEIESDKDLDENVVKNLLKLGKVQRKGEVKELVENLKEDLKKNTKKEEQITSMIIKNKIPINLKELSNMSSFLSNKNQIGQEMKNLLDILNRVIKNREENTLSNTKNKEDLRVLRNIFDDMNLAMKEIHDSILNKKNLIKKPYQNFAIALKKLEEKEELLDKNEQKELKTSSRRLLDSLNTQNNLNRQESLIQIPIIFGGEMKNLQMYILNNKKKTKKIDPKDMSILLNFDTNNMGNMNVYLGVKSKNVLIKVGVRKLEYQNHILNNEDKLKSLLDELGYRLKDLSFKVEENINTMSMMDEVNSLEDKKGVLDLKI